MVQTYTIAGRQVGSHILALATLGVSGVAGWYFMKGDGKAQQAPQIKASSKEEDDFIQEFIRNANAEEQKSKR